MQRKASINKIGVYQRNTLCDRKQNESPVHGGQSKAL